MVLITSRGVNILFSLLDCLGINKGMAHLSYDQLEGGPYGYPVKQYTVLLRKNSLTIQSLNEFIRFSSNGWYFSRIPNIKNIRGLWNFVDFRFNQIFPYETSPFVDLALRENGKDRIQGFRPGILQKNGACLNNSV